MIQNICSLFDTTELLIYYAYRYYCTVAINLLSRLAIFPFSLFPSPWLSRVSTRYCHAARKQVPDRAMMHKQRRRGNSRDVIHNIYRASERTNSAVSILVPLIRRFAMLIYALSNFWFTRPRWNSMNAKCNPLHQTLPPSFYPGRVPGAISPALIQHETLRFNRALEVTNDGDCLPEIYFQRKSWPIYVWNVEMTGQTQTSEIYESPETFDAIV